MPDTTFGQRLKQAFHNASNGEIARKIGVSSPAVSNYMGGRIPDLDKLLKIKAITNCDLDWLLTGDESGITGEAGDRLLRGQLKQRVKTLAREQARHVYGAAQIVSEAVAEQRTLELVIQVLVEEGLKAYGLAADADSLLDETAAADAKRLTFSGQRPTLDDRIRELVRRETSVSSLAQPDSLRDIIREIVREEHSVNVFPIDLKTEQTTRRKKTG